MSISKRLLSTLAISTMAATLVACTGDDEPKNTNTSLTGTPSKAATECADQTLEAMERPERVGQLLLVGVPIDDIRRAEEWIPLHHLGGVFLVGSTNRGAEDITADLKALNEAADGPAPFLAARQEGGEVRTFTSPDFGDLQSAAAQGEAEAQDAVNAFTDSAERLSAAGINLNLAPVADTLLTDPASANPVVGTRDRSFGSVSTEVAMTVHLAVQASVSQDVVPVLTSFPGEGRLEANPATDPAEDATTTADDEQLVPFTTGISAGAEVVEVSNATFTELDPDSPAAFSSAIINDLLRDGLKFGGVIMSSNMAGDGALADVPLEERGVQFIEAGGDIVFGETAGDAATMLKGMLAADGDSPTFAKRVDASAKRVLALKAEHGIISCE